MYAPAPKPDTTPLPRMVGFNIFSRTEEKSADIEVWPENWASVHTFNGVGTQWRVGVGGATGLDYPAVFATIDRMHRDKSDAERDALFRDVQSMEIEALKLMAKNK